MRLWVFELMLRYVDVMLMLCYVHINISVPGNA